MLKNRQHGTIRGQGLGDKARDPYFSRSLRETRKEGGREARSLMSVSDQEGHFGRLIAYPLVASDRDEYVASQDYQSQAIDVVDVGEAKELGGGEVGVRGEVAAIDRVRGEALVKLFEQRGVAGQYGSQVQ